MDIKLTFKGLEFINSDENKKSIDLIFKDTNESHRPLETITTSTGFSLDVILSNLENNQMKNCKMFCPFSKGQWKFAIIQNHKPNLISSHIPLTNILKNFEMNESENMELIIYFSPNIIVNCNDDEKTEFNFLYLSKLLTAVDSLTLTDEISDTLYLKKDIKSVKTILELLREIEESSDRSVFLQKKFNFQTIDESQASTLIELMNYLCNEMNYFTPNENLEYVIQQKIFLPYVKENTIIFK